MSVTVSLQQPRAFTREAVLLFGGGLVSGVAASVLNVVAGAPHDALAALSFGAVIGLGANLADGREGTPMYRLVLSILGGVLMALLMSFNVFLAAGIGGALIGAALLVGEDLEGLEKPGAWLMYGVALGAAMFASSVLVPQFFQTLSPIGLVFQGGVWGVFMGFASGLRRLDWNRDEVMSEFREAEADLAGMEEKDHVIAGRQLYAQILEELERTTETETKQRAIEIANDTGLALIRLSKRSRELRVASEVKLQRHLQTRIAELDDRIQAQQDKTVRRELEATLAELVEQAQVRKRLQLARARVEARQQRCFTSLERLHISLVQHSGGDDSSLEQSMLSLEKLSEEIQWRNLSVDELCEGATIETDDRAVADIVAEAREALSQAESDDEDEQGGTVLDTGASSEEPDDTSQVSELDGTDGHVEEVVQESAHAVHKG